MAWAYLKDPVNLTGFKLGIDLSGGTILVYEVDQERPSRIPVGRPGTGGRAKADASLADALKRRIDPSDLRGVIIRPIGESRVEILMPYKAPKPGEEGAGGTTTSSTSRG